MTRKKLVIALGYFDGVHLGHSALLNVVMQRARELDAEPAVLTFDNHPDTLLTGQATPLIYSSEDRRRTIARFYGIEREVRLHFDADTMHKPWQEFLNDLARTHGVVHFVCGHDFHFGDCGAGGPEELCCWCREHGFSADVIEKVSMDGITISSTHIRRLLEQGEVELANRFLGHRYFLTDTVRHGFENGRKIGFPTINMAYEPGVLVPAHGVYAALAVFDGRAIPAVTNIGVRPTFGGADAISVESHLLDWEGELYGQEVRLEFFRYVRPEQRFNSTQALSVQIRQDTQTVREYFAAHPFAEEMQTVN